jgi:hypothetical protein
MSSNISPQFNPYLHNLLLGFLSFIVLCNIKAAQLMCQLEFKKGRRAHWNDNEIHHLIDLLKRKLKMGQSGSFPIGVLAEVAHYLGAGKDATNIHTKFKAVC